MIKRLTLCFLLRHNEILLAYKKRGFGVGKWNGVGGKVNSHESPKQAAIRETKEEIGVLPLDTKRIGILNFHYAEHDQQVVHKAFIYIARNWLGEIQESEEMNPQWFAFSQIPYASMWEDDKYWFPKMLAGEYIRGNFMFDKEQKLTKWKLQ